MAWLGKGVVCCFSKVQQIATNGRGFSPLLSLVISCKLTAGLSPLPAERRTDICTVRAAYEATTRDGRCSKGAGWGKVVQGIYIIQGSNGQQVPVQCTAPWPSLEGDNRYLNKLL